MRKQKARKQKRRKEKESKVRGEILVPAWRVIESECWLIVSRCGFLAHFAALIRELLMSSGVTPKQVDTRVHTRANKHCGFSNRGRLISNRASFQET